ncbi:hypothetical protein [Rubripirellula reticaptiva]|nr:hypothetical protein [Rubripirellula reticaptiva]
MLARSLYCLAALLSLSLVGVVWHCMTDSAFRYRVLGDEHALLPAIALYVDNGDSLGQVRQTLGDGTPGSHTKAQAWTDIQIQRRDRDGFTDRYPDDILPTDTFVAYSGFPTQFVIQFRDDRVVNLPKAWLAETYSQNGGEP